eukprot:tig00000903_g5525.t1
MSRASEAAENLLREILLGLLRALRPPEGAASRLERLSVRFGGVDREHPRLGWMAWPAAAELRAALAPFAALRALDLSFGGLDADFSPGAAAAVAAACPLLRSLTVGVASAKRAREEALAALAPLGRLERLVVEGGSFFSRRFSASAGAELAAGLAALADGPAGASPRSIEFLPWWESGIYREG